LRYVVRVGTGNFLEGVKMFCPNFFRKPLCNKCSPFKFSVAVGTLYSLSSRHGLESRKFGTLNLVLDNPTEKTYVRLCKKIVRSQLAQHS